MSLASGQVLQNRYRVVSLLGQGGMGAVYRAWHVDLKMPIAIKEMVSQPDLDAASLDTLREQFKQEASVLMRLKHENLVSVYDFFMDVNAAADRDSGGYTDLNSAANRHTYAHASTDCYVYTTIL